MGRKEVRQLKRKNIINDLELKDNRFFRFLAETKIRRKDKAVWVLIRAFDKFTRLKISLSLF